MTRKELGPVGTRYRVTTNTDDFFYKGDRVTLTLDDGTDSPKFLLENGDFRYVDLADLEPLSLPCDITTMIVGDIITRSDDKRKSKVLAVLAPGVYACSRINHYERYGSTYTLKDLEEYGYTYLDPSAPAPLTMTLTEVKEAAEKSLGHEITITGEDK